MDDIVVPLVLAFATAVLTHMVHGVVSAAVRHRQLRGRNDWRDAETAVRE